MARIRRILPALMIVIAVLLALGWFWLPTPDYQALGTQSVSALAFLSNVYFWRSAGYFDAAAQEKWLLHTWSLGVEAQFYALFPIFLIILWKIKPHIKTLFWGLGLVFFASLALSVFESEWRPTAAFYLLPTRGWELAAGGLAFLIGREVLSLQRFAKPMYWLGFSMWLAAVLLLDSTFLWPSGWALLPVTGAVLIILANQQSAKLMTNPIAQWLGDRSYSLYLWHWPLVVALYFTGLQNDWLWIGGALALSFFMAHLSYQLVEVPTRLYLSVSSLPKEIAAIAIAGLLTGLAALSVSTFVFDNRISSNFELIAAEANNKDPRYKECFISATGKGSPECIYGEKNIGVILMGDSHSASVITALGKAASNNNQAALFWGMVSCPTLDNVKYTKHSGYPTNICNELNKWSNQKLKKHTDIPLVLVSRTSSYLMGPNEPERQEGAEFASIYFSKPYIYITESGYVEDFQAVLTETACRLAKDRPIYLMRPVPEFEISIPKTLSRRALFGLHQKDMKIPLKKYHERNSLVWDAQDQAAKQCGVKILNPLPYLCDDTYCYGSKDGRPLYQDDDHLSEYGNKFLVPMFEEVFKDQATQTPP